jgi:hypothetical protein
LRIQRVGVVLGTIDLAVEGHEVGIGGPHLVPVPSSKDIDDFALASWIVRPDLPFLFDEFAVLGGEVCGMEDQVGVRVCTT